MMRIEDGLSVLVCDNGKSSGVPVDSRGKVEWVDWDGALSSAKDGGSFKGEVYNGSPVCYRHEFSEW